MKKRYKKPTGIPEQFVIATRLGWADSRTGEVLESIPNLVERLADYEKYMDEMHERQAETDVDELAPYGVSSFEVHNKSDSLKIQSQQEYTAHRELQSETPKTDTITTPPAKDEGAKPKARATRGSKAKGAAVGSTIVVK